MSTGTDQHRSLGMATPLSPLTPSGQNAKSMSSIAQHHSFKSSTLEPQNYAFENCSKDIFIDEPTETITSSPFIADLDITAQSPSKQRSPTKHRSPRKLSPQLKQGVPLTEHALRENEDLTRPVQLVQEIGKSICSETGNESMSVDGEARSYSGADDTCLSTFSAVPNTDMTIFARIGQSASTSNTSSPTKSTRRRQGARMPIHSRPTTPGTLRQRDYDAELPSSSPTPRRKHGKSSDETTELMIDFTEQLNAYAQPTRSPQRSSPSKNSRHPDLTGYPAAHRLRSPTKQGFFPTSPAEGRHLNNLLDFDLPPAPTPRSIPTITARELESLKSSLLSQISSLKATLSGKEAEITSLKGAKNEAEQRIGVSLEQIRDLTDAKEELFAQKIEWDKRDMEMQGVLRKVKEEIICNEKERQEFIAKTKELEKRCEEAETRAAEAESKIAGLEAGSSDIAKAAADADHGDVSTPGSSSNTAVQVAVEKVARELHTLYKAKHETKVGALKKSYEARWEKRIKEQQAKIEELGRENDELRVGRDVTMSGVVPGMQAPQPPAQGQVESEDARIQREAEAQRVQEMSARLDELVSEVTSIKKANSALRADLETSRRENSELVAAVEQMLLLESSTASIPAVSEPIPVLPHQLPLATSTSDTALGFKSSLGSRASGLKGPGFGTLGGESRLGMMKRNASGQPGLGMRSGIMSNIERMGRGRVVE